MPPIGRKRESFQQFLLRAGEINPNATNENELVQLMEESTELEELARGFRHASRATQLHQDQFLGLYREWVKKTASAQAGPRVLVKLGLVPTLGVAIDIFVKLEFHGFLVAIDRDDAVRRSSPAAVIPAKEEVAAVRHLWNRLIGDVTGPFTLAVVETPA
ncbi:hypothetical protein FALBO_16080 [Fusarium albosuccineum]|uniref:Uncharacterized protein n=1 Tax=Fusarium albosuccineum TaxID=1237068 RepID=A0A8H4P9L4_9HYPO|nr:hypothetical protein FALBO_16080 [Fusarium albosuccineum]